MSGFAAIFSFDGAPADVGEVGRMADAMAYRGPDGRAQWSGGPAAMVHLMLHTTAESLEDVQPLANEDASVVLVMDGWLANPEELRGDLLARGAVLRTRSDAELVLRAYEQWGDESPLHIEGEFAFVVWDARRGEAFCARDHAGLRPLYYHWNERRLVVASDIAAILCVSGVEQRLNRGMAAEFMGGEWFNRDETLWSGVMRLLPAHWMRFRRGGMSQGRYWLPPLEVEIFYKRDEEYIEHYRELFADTVRRSSRTHLPLGCEVSGGLDSTAVFCTAHDLRKNGRLLAPEIKGYSYIFEPGIEADEIEYARAAGRHVDQEVREVEPFIPPLSWFEDRIDEFRDIPNFPNGAMAVAIGNAAVGDGCRVVLNGEGGDEWLWGSQYYYAEQLASGQWRQLFRSLREDASDIGLRQAAWAFYRFGLALTLPEPLRALWRKARTPRGPNCYDGAFWLSPEMEALFYQRRVAYEGFLVTKLSARARRELHTALTFPFMEQVRNFLARQHAWGGYEVRSPYHARRFIDFAFATPERLRMRGNTHKYIHVKALAGVLPEIVLHRKTKAGFSIAFERQLDRMEHLLVDALPTDGTENLDRNGMAKLYARFRQAPDRSNPVWELWGVFGCERLRELPPL